MIRPIPPDKGLGFFIMSKPEKTWEGYRTEEVGRYFNFHFTKNNWTWPERAQMPHKRIVDGFSPNLNKELHVGHMRNLALANAMSKMLPEWKFVAILGAALGVRQNSRKNLENWFEFLRYSPEIHYDVLMPRDIIPLEPGTGKNVGCKVWKNSQGEEVIVFRSNPCVNLAKIPNKEKIIEILAGITSLVRVEDMYVDPADEGKPTYSFHDLVFAALVKPDYYITGNEQVQHFKDLDLAEKHLPMGLVLGPDGKKLKSRTGDALSAQDAMDLIKAKLDDTKDPDKLAWNIVAWNFLHCSRKKNVIFDPDKWTSPDSPGLYITYTYARIKSALKKANFACSEEGATLNIIDHRDEITDLDLRLLGWSEYYHHWLAKSWEFLDTAPLAEYLHDLCRVLGDAYTRERIAGGKFVFQNAIGVTMWVMEKTLKALGMFCLEEV